MAYIESFDKADGGYIKMKDYNKSIEHYLVAKKLLINYENNVNILKFEQKYIRCNEYICLNSKNVFDISYNIGLIYIHINKFDESLKYFIHPYNFLYFPCKVIFGTLIPFNSNYFTAKQKNVIPEKTHHSFTKPVFWI